jgi:hypothetical protein
MRRALLVLVVLIGIVSIVGVPFASGNSTRGFSMPAEPADDGGGSCTGQQEDRMRATCGCGGQDGAGQSEDRMQASGGGIVDAPCGGKRRRRCVKEQEDRALAAGTDEGPPQFSAAFFTRTFKLETSADGLDGDQLPISIEKVCRVPGHLATEAQQLAGSSGVALITDQTRVFKGSQAGGRPGQQLEGEKAMRAIDGADTATLRAQLLQPDSWSEDEDGSQVPTLTAYKIKVTD